MLQSEDWPARLWDGHWILDSQGNTVPPLKYQVIWPLQHHHAVKHTAKWLEEYGKTQKSEKVTINEWFTVALPLCFRDLVMSENNMHNIHNPKGMNNTRHYPDISAFIYNAVALYIEEFRSPVGNGAPLSCPVLYGHGFSASSNL